MDQQLPDATSVLLSVPSFDERETGECHDLLQPAPPTATDSLWVTVTRSPDERIERWNAHVGEHPANLRILGVGEATRSVDTSAASGRDSGSGVVRTVANPADLTGIGIAVSETLREWSDTGNRTVVCVDLLTTLLQYADLQTVYRFVHVFTGRLYAADAIGHFHLDASAHDRQTIDTLASLFDAIVEIEDGERTIRTR